MNRYQARRGLLAPLVAALGAVAAMAPTAAAITLPAGFEHVRELSDLTRPTKIAWAPDGRRFVAEKDGVVRVAASGQANTQVLVDLSNEVNDFSDRGLLGLAVDSDFASHPYLYLLYTYDVNAGPDPDSEAPTVSRLTRVEVNGSNQVLDTKTLLGSFVSGPCPAPDDDVDCIPAEGPSHSIGTVISAPDGTLFVGNGDAASYAKVDPLALRTYDDRSMAGKILHVDREGRGLPAHPSCPTETDLDLVCTKVWAKGFRNPFRFTMRPDGSLLVGDVGWTSREEIDLVTAGGGSYGWPCYEGAIRTPGYKDLDECDAEYAKEGTPNAHRGPIHAYTHSGAPSSAVQAGPWYTGGSYPAEFQGSAFFGDYGQGFIKRLAIDQNGAVTAVHDFAGDWHGVDLSPAPNGDVTWADLGGWGTGAGFIERIVYSPDNAPPIAVADAAPTAGDVPLEVGFDGSGSSDPDGDTLSYDWDFGDGSPHSDEVSPTHTYTAPGTFTATLTVSDGLLSDTVAVQIEADNEPPLPEIEEPADGSLYRDGVPLTVRGSATDPEELTLPPQALEWEVILVHHDHQHLYGSFPGVDEISITPFDDHDADSHYEIRLTARDSVGASASRTIAIRPETIPLHLRSEPSGAELSYAGTAIGAPHDRNAAIGMRTTISATETFEREGRSWVFDRWSDGGARAHDITVPAVETTLTAVYRESSGALVGPIPGPTLNARDRAGPRLGFDRRRGVDLRRHILTGTVSDPDGVRRVYVALAYREPWGCRWVRAKPRLLARHARSCARPRWIAARLNRSGRRWRARLPAALPGGAYRLRFRALDKLGNRSGRLSGGRSLVRLRLRAVR